MIAGLLWMGQWTSDNGIVPPEPVLYTGPLPWGSANVAERGPGGSGRVPGGPGGSAYFQPRGPHGSARAN